MGNEDPLPNPQIIQAPTYNELFELTQSLKSRLELLERNDSERDDTSLPTENSVTPTHNDYWLLPDLNRTVPVFTGHESSCAAED